MQIDIGFGDIVYPAPEEAELPTMLEFPAPKLLCYSRESAIAEKFEAMIKLGFLNSRMKDFYDIWLLSRGFDFTGPELAEAIRLTFEQRQTTLPARIKSFSEDFVNEKQVQRVAFHKKLNQDHIPSDLREIVLHLDGFLAPVISALTTGSMFHQNWLAPVPWQ